MKHNKERAESFLKTAGLGRVAEGFEKYIATKFIHHHQYFEGSREALLNAMQEDHNTNPNVAIEIKSCFSDADKVITHSLVTKESMQIAVVHIFRFQNSKIVELWDLAQIIEKDSPNKNGFF